MKLPFKPHRPLEAALADASALIARIRVVADRAARIREAEPAALAIAAAAPTDANIDAAIAAAAAVPTAQFVEERLVKSVRERAYAGAAQILREPVRVAMRDAISDLDARIGTLEQSELAAATAAGAQVGGDSPALSGLRKERDRLASLLTKLDDFSAERVVAEARALAAG